MRRGDGGSFVDVEGGLGTSDVRATANRRSSLYLVRTCDRNFDLRALCNLWENRDVANGAHEARSSEMGRRCEIASPLKVQRG